MYAWKLFLLFINVTLGNNAMAIGENLVIVILNQVMGTTPELALACFQTTLI